MEEISPFGYLTDEEINRIIENFRNYYKTTSAWKIFQPEESHILEGIVKNIMIPLLNVTKIEKSKIPELEIINQSRFASCRIEKRPGKSIGHEVSELGKDLIQINFNSFHAPGSLKANAAGFADVEDIMRLSAKRRNQLGKLVFNDDVGIFTVFNLRKELVGITTDDLILDYNVVYLDLDNPVKFSLQSGDIITLYPQTLSDPILNVNNVSIAAEYCRLLNIRLPTSVSPFMLRLYISMDTMIQAGMSPDQLYNAIYGIKQLYGVQMHIIMGNFDARIAQSLNNSLDEDRALVVELYFNEFSIAAYFNSISIPYNRETSMVSSYISTFILPAIQGTENHPVYMKGIPRILQINPVVKGISSFIGIVTQIDATWYRYELNKYSASGFGVGFDRIEKALKLYGFTIRKSTPDYIEVNASQKDLNSKVKDYSAYIDHVDLDRNEMVIHLLPNLSATMLDQIRQLFTNQIIRSGFRVLRAEGNTIVVPKMIKFTSLYEMLQEEGLAPIEVITRGNRTFITINNTSEVVAKIQTKFRIIEYNDTTIVIERYTHDEIINDLKMHFGYGPFDIVYGETIGGSIDDLLKLRFANTNLTHTNNPQEIYHTLGIEALYNFLLAELYEILISNGVAIDVAILTTLEAYVTHKAYGIAFNFKGLKNYVYDNVNRDYYETVEEAEEIVEGEEQDEYEDDENYQEEEANEEEGEATEAARTMQSTSFAKLIAYQDPANVILQAARLGSYQDVTTSVAAAELVSQVPKIGSNIPRVNTLVDVNDKALDIDVYVKGKDVRLMSDIVVSTKPAPPMLEPPKLSSGLVVRPTLSVKPDARVNTGELRSRVAASIIRTPAAPLSDRDGISTLNLTLKVSTVKPPTRLPAIQY